MMDFEPIVSPLFAWIFGIGIAALLIFQAIQIQKSDFTPKRKGVKQLLNTFLFSALLVFMLNPLWNYEQISKPILLVSEEVEKSEIDFWKDSLGVEKVLSAEDFQSNSDSLILLGNDFAKNFLYSIRAKSVDWIIPSEADNPEFLEWKGILYQGENQKIRLKMDLISGSTISIFQEGNELEKIEFDSDRNSLELGIPVSILGRNEWEIKVNDESIGTIRFFVIPSKQLTFQIQAGFPGPEIRTLSRYLIGKGEQVQEEIRLSKDTELLTGRVPFDSVDVFVIDPSQLSNTKIQNKIRRGASLVLINLNNPEKEIDALNKVFKTNFEVLKTGSGDNREVTGGLAALPFTFKEKNLQESLFENALAVQRFGDSKIGVSMLASTFSITQSGDSVGYDKIWCRILGEIRPESQSYWGVSAPVFQGEYEAVSLNSNESLDYLVFGNDTLSLSQSLINPKTKTLDLIPLDSGWVKFGEIGEVYVSGMNDWPSIIAQQQRAAFLQSQAWNMPSSDSISDKAPIPFWAWGLILFLLLTLIWLEPKLWD
ncbi:MAG: hypothetical protein P8O16_08315 [Algoriphagus sp.]|uniref:hypothetical protein n=1 Tax=Algoriphagus sp. TaxID=1872435 RepID=UPI002605CA49|nr:hypothetical protein [Algoriphagus sp.]MDG1277269.1 hypothetical protein [Algoriphagus sp.]